MQENFSDCVILSDETLWNEEWCQSLRIHHFNNQLDFLKVWNCLLLIFDSVWKRLDPFAGLVSLNFQAVQITLLVSLFTCKIYLDMVGTLNDGNISLKVNILASDLADYQFTKYNSLRLLGSGESYDIFSDSRASYTL